MILTHTFFCLDLQVVRLFVLATEALVQIKKDNDILYNRPVAHRRRVGKENKSSNGKSSPGNHN